MLQHRFKMLYLCKIIFHTSCASLGAAEQVQSGYLEVRHIKDLILQQIPFKLLKHFRIR